MRIPGNKRSQEPDDIGNRAGLFAEEVRYGSEGYDRPADNRERVIIGTAIVTG